MRFLNFVVFIPPLHFPVEIQKLNNVNKHTPASRHNGREFITSIIIFNMQSALQDSEHIKTDAKHQCRNDGLLTWWWW